MKNLNKKLAYGLWTVSGISALISIMSTMSYLVIIAVFQGLLGYTVLRDKNDKLTMISVILITIFTFNLGGLVAFIMRLVLRKKDSEKIRNAWFVPAIVSGALALINLFLAFSFIGIVGLILNVAFYLIFGYWFLKYLKVN